MTLRTKVWVVAVLFSIVNLAGGVWAVNAAEPMHASIHGVLFVLGAYLCWKLAPRRAADRYVA